MNNKKLTVAFIGCGRFAKFFVPLFKAHPFTKKVYVCDLIPEKAKLYSERFGVEIINSFEDVLNNSFEEETVSEEPEVDAVSELEELDSLFVDSIDDVEKAMEPLFTTKPELERSGMGFSFMEAFMEKVVVESEPKKGTKVKMWKEIGVKGHQFE